MIQRKILQSLKTTQIARCFTSNINESSSNNDREKRRRFLRQSQGLHAFRPGECPDNPTIVLFPGQGSQFVGMAKSLTDISEAKDMFDMASEILRLHQTVQLMKTVNEIIYALYYIGMIF